MGFQIQLPTLLQKRVAARPRQENAKKKMADMVKEAITSGS